MTLIQIKKRFVAPLPALARLALRYVYDRKHMKADDINLMQKSIIHWSKKMDITPIEQDCLERIAHFLKKDEEGKLEKQKETFKRHKILWSKYHKTPDLARYDENA